MIFATIPTIFPGRERIGIIQISSRNMDPRAMDANLDSFRPYLTVLARGQIPAAMQARLDASDIVQETLLEALRKREQYRGSNDPKQIAGWLRELLSCNLIDALRAQRRESRDVNREQSIAKSVDESSMGLEHLLTIDQSTPSQIVERRFRALEVAQAIEELPEQQRDAIMYRYFQKSSLDQIALQMDKSKPAVAGLLKRGLETLRRRLRREEA
jgi:RNA polymerase sigma-70 factor (ECF subfamily)